MPEPSFMCPLCGCPTGTIMGHCECNLCHVKNQEAQD